MGQIISAMGTCLIVFAVAGAQAQPVIRGGEPFPTLVLPTMKDGSPASITNFRGTKVVLHIFASW